MLFLDGAYTFSGSRASFHRARRPQPDELLQLLDSLSRRIVQLLERRGLLIAKILGHIRARDEATSIEVRAPPGRVEGVLKRA